MAAAPMPNPMHMETSPQRCFLSCISYRSCVVSFAPVHPSGWPRAMGPAVHVDDVLPDAQLPDAVNSLRCKGLVQLDQLDLIQAHAGEPQDLGDGHCGTHTMYSGGHPSTACIRKVAMGLRPSSLALCLDNEHNAGCRIARLGGIARGDASIHLEGGLQPGKGSFVVPGRTPSSVSKITLIETESAVGQLLSEPSPLTGTIWLLNRPSLSAASAFCWLPAPNSSCSSRVIPYLSATFSAVRPMPLKARAAYRPGTVGVKHGPAHGNLAHALHAAGGRSRRRCRT